MTTLTLQPGLRPAHLPPTLQPHAVLSLAPPTDRRRSLGASLAVYALVGGGALWLGRARAEARPPLMPVGPIVLLNPAPFPRALPAFHPPSPAHAPLLAQPPAMPSQLIPDAPAQLPTQDLSNQPPAPAVPDPAGAAGPAGGPITLSGDAVRILRQVNPAYPSMAVAAHLQGQVVIRMTIDAQGLPAQVEAVSGPQVFQEPAMRAARQWRFEPARQNGEPVPATFLLTLNFVLR